MNYYQKAENALKFYKGYKGNTKEEVDALFEEFERLKAITNQQKIEEKIQISDFCKFKRKNLIDDDSFLNVFKPI